MNLLAAALLVLLVASAAAHGAQPTTNPVLPHRSWQFQDLNWDYLKDAIPKARAAGMNRIQLSHRIIMDAQNMWENEQRATVVKAALKLAHEHGLKVDIWVHELSGISDATLKQGEQAIWDFVRAKYKRLFEILPDVDGLVLTFAETQHIVYRTPITNDPPAVRVAKLIDLLSQICAEKQKTLLVRTFSYEPQDLAFIGEALEQTAKALHGRGNVIVMTKCVPHDWTPFYPFNPRLGKTAGLPQVVEIDLGQEFTGQSALLHCEVDYVKRILDYSRSRGIIGAVARVERMDRHALGTPNEVNIHAFSRLLHDPELSVDALWTQWLEQRYPRPAAPHLRRALERTFDITNLTCFPLEQWITNHSELPSWSYAYGHITERQNAKWIASPHQQRLRDELLRPTEDTLLKIETEKDLARRFVELSLADLAKARPHLSEPDHAALLHHLELARENVELFRQHNLAMFSTLCARELRRQQAPAEHIKAMTDRARRHVALLRQQADRMEKLFGPSVWPGKPKTARAFADEVEAQLARDADQ